MLWEHNADIYLCIYIEKGEKCFAEMGEDFDARQIFGVNTKFAMFQQIYMAFAPDRFLLHSRYFKHVNA